MAFKEKEKKNNKLWKGLALIGGVTLGLGFMGWAIKRNKGVSSQEETSQDNYHELDLSKKTKRYFLVYQNTNYEEEKTNGYIWAPQETDSGRSIFHWENLRRVRKEDLVFSMVDRKIVSVNSAESNCYEYELNGVKGYRVDLDYKELEESIDIEDYMDRILELSPDKYAPFNIMGRSNSGYLFDLGDRLGEYIESIVDVEG